MERAEAVAFLKEVAATNALIPNWVSLVNDGNSGYYVQIKPEFIDSSFKADCTDTRKMLEVVYTKKFSFNICNKKEGIEVSPT